MLNILSTTKFIMLTSFCLSGNYNHDSEVEFKKIVHLKSEKLSLITKFEVMNWRFEKKFDEYVYISDSSTFPRSW